MNNTFCLCIFFLCFIVKDVSDYTAGVQQRGRLNRGMYMSMYT